jgi:hypothetical protein
MINILTKCPVCEGNLKAVKLKCETCDTVIENSFDFPKLLKLSKEQLEFVTVFLKSRGNIKDVERELGISYPTVRAKLDQVVELLGDDSASKNKTTREDILNKIESGELSPEEAVILLNNLK